MSADNGDKRKVSTDALETLGAIIGDGEKRDAIHLAVEPMVATVVLNPGQHVTAKGLPAIPNRGVGIVDPFTSSPSRATRSRSRSTPHCAGTARCVKRWQATSTPLRLRALPPTWLAIAL